MMSKKICPTPSSPSSLGLVVQESFILPSKEEGIMSRKKPENVNEDTIGNEIVTSDQLTSKCNARHIFLRTIQMYYKLYLFSRKSNRRLEFNDTVFCHLSVLKGGEELLQGSWTGGGHVFFA